MSMGYNFVNLPAAQTAERVKKLVLWLREPHCQRGNPAKSGLDHKAKANANLQHSISFHRAEIGPEVLSGPVAFRQPWFLDSNPKQHKSLRLHDALCKCIGLELTHAQS